MRDVVSGRLSPRRNVAALAAIALAGSPGDGREAATRRRGRGRPGPVNLVGYAATGTKRAYLMSGAVETGATFAVKSGSTTVLSGAGRRRPGLVEQLVTATSTRSTSIC